MCVREQTNKHMMGCKEAKPCSYTCVLYVPYNYAIVQYEHIAILHSSYPYRKTVN